MRMKQGLAIAALLFSFVTGAAPPDPEHCSELLEGNPRMMKGTCNHPTKFRVVFDQRVSFDHLDTHDLQGMLGQYGNKIQGALYEDAKSILFLSDGRDQNLVERLGPPIAKEFPKKWVVSAELNVVEDGFVNNWGLIKIDNTERFPVKDNAFDRIVLRRGMCVCHEGRCCAGFKPASPENRTFLSEVVRILNKKDPHAMAVLHGMHDVGMAEIYVWTRFLDEIAAKEPIRYRMMYDHQGHFHSILIQSKALLH
jgi:hypothetical protein